MSCQSFLQEKKGAKYSPYIELYTEMGLPILDGMQELWEKDMKARATILIKKSAAVKKKRIELKTARIEEQEERKQWAKRQKILHQYGEEEDSDDSSDDGGQELVDDAMLVLCEVNEETSKKGKGKAKSAQKPCKCGSTMHSRTSFRDALYINDHDTSVECASAVSIYIFENVCLFVCSQ